MDEKVVGVIATKGKRYRVIIPYKDQKYVLIRFQVSNDSSFYLFDTPADHIRHGSSTIKAGSTKTNVDITQGELIEDPSTLETDHYSHHGSGYVKTPIGRFYGPPLRNLTKPCQLQIILFPHISKLRKINNLRLTDIIIDYPIDEKGPLVVDITAAPRSNVPKRVIPTATFQWSYVFVYKDLLKNDDLVIMLTFYHSPGEWPIARVSVTPPDIVKKPNR